MEQRLFFVFFFLLQRLLLDNESEMMAAKCTHINLSAFSTMTAQFSVPPRTISRLSVYMSLRADADYARISQIQFGYNV